MKKIKIFSILISFIILISLISVSFSSCQDAVKAPISSEKKLLSFYFLKTLNSTLINDTIFGTIDETNHTVSVIIPQIGLNISSLKASFTNTNLTSIAIGKKLQESGITQNNFSTVQSYTITALDGSTQTYLVTVTVQATAANSIEKTMFNSKLKNNYFMSVDLSIYPPEI